MHSPSSAVLERPIPRRGQRVGVQHLMSPHSDLAAAAWALDRVGEQMGVQFDLRHDTGDIVLLDGALQDRLSPQMIHALREERPLVTLPGVPAAHPSVQGRHQHSPQAVMALLQQFRALPVLVERRRNRPDLTATTRPELPDWLQQLVLGRLARSAAPGAAAGVAPDVVSYGPQACMRFDLASAQVACDSLALQHLRLHRELPQPVAQAALQTECTQRSLDRTLWDLGIAAGACALLQAPADAWHAPLLCVVGSSVGDYTRSPMHLEALRQLQGGPLSPSQLRRRVRASESELRQLLQAGLFLGLVQWAGTAGGTDPDSVDVSVDGCLKNCVREGST